MYKAYETGQLMHGLTRMVRTGESYIEATKDAVDSYLCTDGRPVSTTTSRYGGDKEIYGQFRDRDYRLYLTICPPYMVKKENGPSTADWKYTDDAQDREFIDLLLRSPVRLIIVCRLPTSKDLRCRDSRTSRIRIGDRAGTVSYTHLTLPTT